VPQEMQACLSISTEYPDEAILVSFSLLLSFLANFMPSIPPQQQEQQEQITPVRPPVSVFSQAAIILFSLTDSCSSSSASAWVILRT
jgi:hypothetical protein